MIKIPSERKYIRMVKDVLKDTCTISSLSKKDMKALLESVEELVHNAIIHAYKEEKGYIQVSIHPFKTGIRVDVHDWGIPMSRKKHKSVPLNSRAYPGFNRIYKLADHFEYKNLYRYFQIL